MLDLVHNFATRKQKRDTTLESVADAIPKLAGESSQLSMDGLGGTGSYHLGFS